MQQKVLKGWLLPLLLATMIVALFERDDICGLAQEIDLWKDLHVLAFNKLSSKLADWYQGNQ